MIDTCQANTMYSKFYSPNILATGSSVIHENSYSVSVFMDPPFLCADRSFGFSMRTITTSALQSSTVTHTTFSSSWKASARPARNPCKILCVSSGAWLPRPSDPSITAVRHL